MLFLRIFLKMRFSGAEPTAVPQDNDVISFQDDVISFQAIILGDKHSIVVIDMKSEKQTVVIPAQAGI